MDTKVGSLMRALARAPAVELPPTAIARFRVTRTIGAGGMGVVYEAVDPTLDRRVAIKLLREGSSERLLREAHALAKLSHPNVVTIYEAGRDGDRVYLAMELVVGATARQWLDAAPRTRDEILDVYRQAARGLAAAHAAGLVHRDIKPENILVGDDGRVRVTDFGLVGAVSLEASTETPTDVLAVTLTQTGAVMGTPPYMPPEAHRGELVDARGDQWSLAVTIWEALGGARPHPSTSYPALVDAIFAGALDEPPTPLPAHVRPALERALAVEAADRWPSVDAMMGALAPPHPDAPPTRLVALAIGGGLAAAAAITMGFIAWQGHGGTHPAAAATSEVAPPPAPPSVHAVALTEFGDCSENPLFLDDETVVFQRTFGDAEDLYAMSRTGGEARRLTAGIDDQWGMRPGPNPGELTYFRRPNGVDHAKTVVSLRAADGTVRDLPFDVPHYLRGPSVVVIGNRMYYARNDANVGVVTGGVDGLLVTLPSDRQVMTLSSSPDGRWLAIDTARTPGTCFVDLHAATPSPECVTMPGAMSRTWFDRDSLHSYRADARGVVRYDRETGAQEVVAPDIFADSNFTVSPDRRTLVYSDCDERRRLLDIEGRNPTEVLAGRIGEPRVGPGDRIAYMRRQIQGETIVVRDPDGTIHDLTDPALGLSTSPTWDAEGRRLVFRIPGEGLAIVDVETKALIRLTSGHSDQRAVFLRDGRVVFNRFDGQLPQLWVVDPAGGEPALLFDRPWYLWDIDRTTDALLVTDEFRHLVTWLDPATGAERAQDRLEPVGLSDHGFDDESVALDGSALYLASRSKLWRVDLHGTAPATTVFELDGYDTELSRPVPLANGHVMVSAMFWTGELYRVELPDPSASARISP